MEKWFSKKSGMSNGELLCVGLALFFVGRLLTAPDAQTAEKAFALGVGVGAGAASAAGEAQAPQATQLQTDEQQPAPVSYYEPPGQFGYPGPGYGGGSY